MGVYEVLERGVCDPDVDRQPWHGERAVLGIEALFYKRLFDGMRCGILAIDGRGRLVRMNELAAQVLDMPAIPPTGTFIEDALADQPQLLQVLKDCFSMSHLPNREELVLGKDPGAHKTIGYTISLVAEPDGVPTGAAVFFKDLTLIEQKAEQERLQERLAALGQMAASLAHEIRNPLASIDVTCSLLRRRLGADEPSRGMLDKISAEISRLNGTITSSLEFVRPVSLNPAMARLESVLEEAITVARDRCGGSVQIRTDFKASIPEFVMDRAQVRQVFENLILNAAEAAGEGGSVWVQAEVAADGHPPVRGCATDGCDASPLSSSWIEVRVIDNGPGITSEDRDKIFHPFFTTKEHGSGVGLSMAKKIVDSHRGTIAVESPESGGCTFTIRLPLVQVSPEDC